MGNGFSFPTSFPSLNNAKSFGSGIIDKFPSANNVRRFGSGIGTISSKAVSATSSALSSQTAQTAMKTTGAVAAAVLTNGRSLNKRPQYRRSSSSLLTVKIGGSKKKEISDKSKTVHDKTTSSKKEKTPSKKEKKPSKK